jgi:hypothetical protein
MTTLMAMLPLSMKGTMLMSMKWKLKMVMKPKTTKVVTQAALKLRRQTTLDHLLNHLLEYFPKCLELAQLVKNLQR